MRARRNQTAKKRLGRKQTKKYGLRKLMFGGVLTKEEALEALKAKIEKYKKQLREILKQITGLKEALKTPDVSDEDKGKIDAAITQLMVTARTQKEKIEEKTTELKKKEEAVIAELQEVVNKDFEDNPSGFSAARATQSVVGSIAHAENAMENADELASELEESVASVSTGATPKQNSPKKPSVAYYKGELDKINASIAKFVNVTPKPDKVARRDEIVRDLTKQKFDLLKEASVHLIETIRKTKTAILDNKQKKLNSKLSTTEKADIKSKIETFETLLQKLETQKVTWKQELDALSTDTSASMKGGATRKKHQKIKNHRKQKKTTKW
jgi:hypothetical protein